MAMAPGQGRLEVGAGPGEPDTGDGDGDGDGLGVADPDGVAERDGVGERLGCGLRHGLGWERTGLGADDVGPGKGFVTPVGWGAGTCGGRTRMYSASTPRNRPVSTTVEVRGRLLMRRLRSRGRCPGRRRR